MENLIQEYNIQDTRTKYYKKPERFADYVFTSSDLSVNHFHLFDDVVSDHAPLFCDFD
jgi:endonuclease/exonuclease/phosphatase family metal-dependent hydrolase